MIEELDGLTPADIRRHPIRQTLRAAAVAGNRGLPTEAELDALKLPPSLRKNIIEGCREVAEIHDTGHQRDAWVRADDLARDTIDGAPESHRHPDELARTLAPPDTTEGLAPTELANLVPRNGIFVERRS